MAIVGAIIGVWWLGQKYMSIIAPNLEVLLKKICQTDSHTFSVFNEKWNGYTHVLHIITYSIIFL